MSPSSPVADDWGIINVANVGSVGVDAGGVVVAADHDDGRAGQRATEGVLVGVVKSGVAGEGAASVGLLVGDLLDLLPTEIKSGVADAAVGVGVVAGVGGTLAADSVDLDVAGLAKTAAQVPVLVEAADGRHEGGAGLVDCVVDLVMGALAAVAVHQVVPEGAHAGLLGSRVDLVLAALDQDARAVDEGVVLAAATLVVGGEVGPVFRAALADVLDDDESRETDTLAIEEVLVDAAGVDADTLFEQFVVVVALPALAADSVDGVKAGLAVTVPGGHVEDLVDAAAIALGLVAVLYFDGRSAAFTVLRVGEDCQKEQQGQRFVH
jgi:hypothetical protein